MAIVLTSGDELNFNGAIYRYLGTADDGRFLFEHSSPGLYLQRFERQLIESYTVSNLRLFSSSSAKQLARRETSVAFSSSFSTHDESGCLQATTSISRAKHRY
jgi:hypothetical protein